MGDIEKGNSFTTKYKSNSASTTTLSTITESTTLMEDELSEIQPALHEGRKNCCESLFKGLFITNYDLTINEYKAYNKLKRDCLVSYDENVPKHEEILKDFYQNFVEVVELDEQMKVDSRSWKSLGFQVKCLIIIK
jgi:hypothetical protein